MLKFHYLKIFVSVLSIFLIYSCDNTSNSSSEQQHKLKIEHYLDTIQLHFKNYKTNTAIKDELNNFFKQDFKNALDNGVLSDLPFKLDRAEKCGDKYILSLNYSLTDRYYNDGILGKINLDLYAITDEKTAKSLIEKNSYLVNVAFRDYLTFQNNEDYCAVVLMSPFMGFGSGVTDDEIEFGAIGVRLLEIKPFKP